MGPSQESTTESDSSPAIKPIKWANVALRFAKTPNPSQQYQHLTSAEPVLLFKSGQTMAGADPLSRRWASGDRQPHRRTSAARRRYRASQLALRRLKGGMRRSSGNLLHHRNLQTEWRRTLRLHYRRHAEDRRRMAKQPYR